jgi:four helix bundle protein
MFLTLNHQNLKVYKTSRDLSLHCYRITKVFPVEEKYAMTQQIRRAALSVYLNIAEGSSRKSEAERRRFFEIARGSLIEIDAALDIAFLLEYFTKDTVEELGKCLIESFKLLSSMIKY